MKNKPEIERPDCTTCKHKGHDLGKCKQCNCGESEIIRFSDTSNNYVGNSDFSDRINRIYNHRDTVMGERNYKVSRR